MMRAAYGRTMIANVVILAILILASGVEAGTATPAPVEGSGIDIIENTGDPVLGRTTLTENRSYLLDSQLCSVLVVGPQGKYLESFGREGDGPGEFRSATSVLVGAEGIRTITVPFPARWIEFDSTGIYSRTVMIPPNDGDRYPRLRSAELLESRRILHCVDTYFGENGEVVSEYLAAYDHDGCETARYTESRRVSNPADPVYDELDQMLVGRWAVTRDGKVYVAADFSDYLLDVYDSRGQHIQRITRDFEHRRRSKEERQAVHDWATAIPNSLLPGTRIDIEDNDKDIMALYTGFDGRCWVLTSRGMYDRPEGTIGVFDVFDENGQYLREVTLQGQGDPARDKIVFKGNRVYVVRFFRDSILSAYGAEGDHLEGSLGESELATVICYELTGY